MAPNLPNAPRQWPASKEDMDMRQKINKELMKFLNQIISFSMPFHEKDMDKTQKINKELKKFQKQIISYSMRFREKVDIILMEGSLTKSIDQAEPSRKRKEIPFQVESPTKSRNCNKRMTLGQSVQEIPNKVGSSSNAKIPNRRNTQLSNHEIPNQVGSSSKAKIPNRRNTQLSNREIRNQVGSSSKSKLPNRSRTELSNQDISNQLRSSSRSKLLSKRKTLKLSNQEISNQVRSSSRSELLNKKRTVELSNHEMHNQIGSSSSKSIIPNRQSVQLLKDSEINIESKAFTTEMLESLNDPGLIEGKGYIRKPLCSSYKFIIKEGADPLVVSRLFSYGLLHSIFPSEDLREMDSLPSVIKNQIQSFKTILKPSPIPIKFCIKCFSIIPEWDPARMRKVETIHVLIMRTATNEYVAEEQKTCDLEEKDLEQIPVWRAQNVTHAYRALKKMVQESKKGYFCNKQQGILFVNMANKWKDKHLMEELVSRIEKGEMDGSKQTLENTCRLLKADDQHHVCGICQSLSS